MPPLAGPRPRLCWTRKPVKTWTEPSSIFTGKWTVSSRRGSRRTRRMPSSRFRRSAARSNCRCATSHGLMWVATCSVVMDAGYLIWIVIWRCAKGPSIGVPRRASRPSVTTRQPCRNRAAIIAGRWSPASGLEVRPRSAGPARVAQPVVGPRSGLVERDAPDAARAEVRPDRGPDQIHGDRRGVDAAGDAGLELRGELLDPGVRRVEDREALHRSSRQQLDQALPSLSLGPNAIDRLHEPIGDLDDRLDREQRSDRCLRTADPAAALEVLERVEGEVDPDVVAALRDDPGDLL